MRRKSAADELPVPHRNPMRLLAKNPSGFNGYATIVDTEQCTTDRPLVGTTGTYYNDFESLNLNNGKKMAVCPAT